MTRTLFDASATAQLDAFLQDLVLSLYQAGPNGTQALPDAATDANAVRRVRQLLEEGANPRGCGAVGLETRSCPFLATAADIGSAELVRMLLEAGADPNQASADTGDVPLHLTRTADVVRLLATAGAHLETLNGTMGEDEPGMTPLHRAVLAGHRDTVRALLAVGAQPNAANADGEPLLHAALFADTGILQDLLDAGADPDALDRHDRDADERMRDGGFLNHESRAVRLAMLDAARLARSMGEPAPSSAARPRL